MKPIVIALILILNLAGCTNRSYAPPGEIVSDMAWAKRVTSRRDDFRRTTEYKGATFEGTHHSAFLRSIKADAFPQEEGMVLYILFELREWEFLDTTYSSAGDRLPTSVVDREVGYCGRNGCSLAEHVAVHVTREYLLTKIHGDGLLIKVAGKRGEQLVQVLPNYIAGFLASVPRP